MGTGFAIPISIGEWKIMSIIGSKRVPIGSMCGIGFKVRRPIYFAVGSPFLKATYPWEISWTITEKNTIIKKKIISTIYLF